MTTALKPKLTRAGLSAVLRADNTGLEAQITHVVFGNGGGAGYNPTGDETALKGEKARVAIGGGERTSPHSFVIQSQLNDSDTPDFWIHEVGFELADGTLLAIWSAPNTPLGYKTKISNFITAFELTIAEIPPESVNVTVTGPNVNIMFERPAISFAHAILSLQKKSMENTWDANWKNWQPRL